MGSVLEAIKDAVEKGEADAVKELTQKAVADGHDVKRVLDDALIAGLESIGRRWKEGDAYIPEVLVAAEAMQAGMPAIKELVTQSGAQPRAKVVIGTVQGDVHDIGKSLVGMMMEAFGFDVQDLGVDVPPVKFVEAARVQGAQIVCMSALLTTVIPHMEETIKALREAGLKVTTMVGGSPLTQEYADRIGADGYASDAISAVDKAKELLGLGD